LHVYFDCKSLAIKNTNILPDILLVFQAKQRYKVTYILLFSKL